jgi:hypothetical protein
VSEDDCILIFNLLIISKVRKAEYVAHPGDGG